jgi:hypothetical protein
MLGADIEAAGDDGACDLAEVIKPAAMTMMKGTARSPNLIQLRLAGMMFAR